MKYLIAFLLSLSVALTSVSFVFYNKIKHVQKEVDTLAIDPKILEEKLAKEPPEWMIRQIRNDLAPYASGITRQMIDESFYGKKTQRCQIGSTLVADGDEARVAGRTPSCSQPCRGPESAASLVRPASQAPGMAGTSEVM